MEHFDKNLLNKYYQNKCTPAEYKLVVEWFSTEEGQAYLSEQIEIDAEVNEPIKAKTEKAEAKLERLYNRILLSIKPEYATANSGNWFKHNLNLKIAAIWIGLFCLTYAAIQFYQNQRIVTCQTGFGQIETIKLPDESVVTLNANSTLRYRNNWNKAGFREVWLQGEAFFSVTHQKNHQRFIVHTAHQYNVEVLGTKFNVLDRVNRFLVVLNSGKVRLSKERNSTGDTIIMKPGDLVGLKQKQGLYRLKTAEPQNYSAWKARKLHFDQASFADVAQVLKETYGLTIEVRDSSLLNQHISGTVPNDNENTLLDGLSQLFHLQITRMNDKVMISKKVSNRKI